MTSPIARSRATPMSAGAEPSGADPVRCGGRAPDSVPHGDLWVFGYGSLMWRPGFVYTLRSKAMLRGWRRSLCIYSHVYRGTRQEPGLVLGLDRGGACPGVAFRVAAALSEPTIRYLREREQATSVYLERMVPVTLESGERVNALAYVADRLHDQYAGRLDRRGDAGDRPGGPRPVGRKRRLRARDARPSRRHRRPRRRPGMAGRAAALRQRGRNGLRAGRRSLLGNGGAAGPWPQPPSRNRCMLDISEVENIGVEAPVKAFSAVPIVAPLELITCERIEEAPDAVELELPVYAVSEELDPDAGP